MAAFYFHEISDGGRQTAASPWHAVFSCTVYVWLCRNWKQLCVVRHRILAVLLVPLYTLIWRMHCVHCSYRYVYGCSVS